jgi:hypothetical protein
MAETGSKLLAIDRGYCRYGKSMKNYNLTITLLEDLHTGSGTGAGDYDALLARDRNGLPVISASHWMGVCRDNLKRYLEHQKKPLNEFHALFGKTNGQRGSLTATALYALHKEIESLSWSSTSRELDSRAPKENTLRTREFIPAGSQFVARLWLTEDSLADVLQLACRLTDRLGGRRQRGDGWISAQLHELPPEEKSLPTLSGTAIRMLLRANDPICLPITGYPGNIIQSECYIRGQVLRGALLGSLLRQGHRELAQDLFQDSFSVTNAYPLPFTEIPSHEDWLTWQVAPMPLHFELPKPAGGNEDGWPWWAMPDSPMHPKDQFSRQVNDEKLKRPADNAFIFNDGKTVRWQSFNVPLTQRLRNGLPSNKHPEGALFAQEEIPERALFLAEMQFPNLDIAQQAVAALQSLFNGCDCLNLGRGGSPITIERWHSIIPETINTIPNSDSEIRITLTSDLIARSSSLSFYQNLTPQVLCELCDLSMADFPEAKNWKGLAFCDYVEVHGFNATTALPRLTALAIRRGSAITIQGQGLSDLRQALMQRTALGERTQEGFGRFLLDFSPVIEAALKQSPKLNKNLTEQIFQQAEQAFQELPEAVEKWPKLAQWQALRYHESQNGKTLADQIEAHKRRLEAKKDTHNAAKIAWLKPGPNNASWIEWLLAHLNVIEPDLQRTFYRALLSQIRLKLRVQGEHHG